MKILKLRWMVLAAACMIATGLASAQSVDAFVGVGTLLTGVNSGGGPKLGAGAFPDAGGDLIFLPYNLGIGAQVTWRASQQDYFGIPTRPLFYTFNLMWEPVPTGNRIRPDFAIGLGAQSLRAYTGTLNCGTVTGCTDYVSNSHFALHAGIGVKMYWGGHLFLRPALDFYNIKNDQKYGVPGAWQVGVSLGYTLGPSQ